MVTFLGSLVQSCCGDGGTLQTNVTGVWGECSQCLGHTGFAPAHGMCAFPSHTAQAVVCSAGSCLRQALGCMHFPGLSHSGSGSWVLHEGADSVGPAFLPFSSLSSSGDQVLCQRSRPQLGAESHRLPQPSRSVFWVYHGHAFSGVPCVSSGELISGGDPPGGCRPSRIPRSLG